MSNSAILLTSDNVIRYGSLERKIVKPCFEFECAEETCSQGGIGFGNEGSYVRFTTAYDYPGGTNINFVERNDFYIKMNDEKRLLICLDNTEKNNKFTVMKDEEIRIHTFKFVNNIKTIKLITYLGSISSNIKDNLILYTHENEFQNTIPEGYLGWADGNIITCYNQRRSISLFNLLSIFII